ncbi:LOG family protein [Flavisphingomonas formosensis]|uniref:LOG family protein n=1 Tax=Flavisphingomonas formosensis TaxID=861534 RepID=UPI0018DFA899|nr:TIGR00730 family Rossman fold protein [Sphingomonas formosensis]
MTNETPASGRAIRAIAIFCGSNSGDGNRYIDAAASLGQALARRGIMLVYGGTHKGLMGVLANAALDAGGTVHGVITERLHGRGHLHDRLSVHEIVSDMRVRKERMLDLSDACIALPGGLGTLEEFMEAWTLNQLGDVDKPVGLLNVDGYYAPLMTMIDMMITHRFLPPAHRDSVVLAEDPDALIDGLLAQPPMSVPKWMS